MWWGKPALLGGSRKRRAFLVISDDRFNENPAYPKVLVVHGTSVPPAKAYPWEVRVPRGTASLPAESYFKCAEIYTVFKADLETVTGTLPRHLMDSVDAALALVMALPSGSTAAPN